MEKEIKGIIDWKDVRYWVSPIRTQDLMVFEFVEFDKCTIERNGDGSINIKNEYYKMNFDLYPSGIKAIIYK